MNALLALTATHTTRFLRRGVVVRSMAFPAVLGIGTLLITLVVLAYLRDNRVAMGPDAVELQQLVADAGFQVLVVDEPVAALDDGGAWAAWDGENLHIPPSPLALKLEVVIREHLDTTWRPRPYINSPDVEDTRVFGFQLSRIFVVMFILYGVVLGAAAVGRDRDDGSLDAERSTPIPPWMPGASRWMATTLILSGFLLASLFLLAAVWGGTGPDYLVHSVAATGVASAIGIGVAAVGRRLSRDLALGLTLVAGLTGLGLWSPHVPIGAVMHDHPPPTALWLSVIMVFASIAWFGWRTSR
jgi:hypothetical protein